VTRLVERVVRTASNLALGQGLALRLLLGSTALQQAYVEASSRQGASDGDAGGARPDDTQVRFDDLAFGDLLGVDEHLRPSSGRRIQPGTASAAAATITARLPGGMVITQRPPGTALEHQASHSH